MTKDDSFENRLAELKKIDEKLNNGLGLQDTLKYYKKGKELANSLTASIKDAKETFAKVETNDGKEIPYNRDKNGKDIDEKADVNSDNQNSQENNNQIPTNNPY